MAEITINDPRWDALVQEHGSAPHHGPDFLTWHSSYIVRFRELLKNVPQNEWPDLASIRAWTKVPEDLKIEFEVNGRKEKWNPDWDSLETNIQTNIASFKSLDDLASKINPLHDFLHTAVGQVHKEPHIAVRASAPRSTYFWQIHGLVELWHLDWRRALFLA